MENQNNNEKMYSRRDTLKFAGKAIAGVAIAGSIPTLLGACSPQKAELPSKEVLNYTYAEASKDAASHPYTYQKLDVSTAVERGHAGYYNKGNCCIGTADAIIGQLADNTGYPFNQIPVEMFINGGSGYAVGTLCGALGGAVAAIGLVCEPDDAKALTRELFSWYTTAEIPVYQPSIETETTISPTVNCLDSVSTWMDQTGLEHGSKERKERCASLTGDVAGKTVELLNKHFNL